MNVAQKSRLGKTQSRSSPAEESLSFVVDPEHAVLVSATKPACRLWGLSVANTQFPLPLDRAMPAIATLALLARTAGARVVAQQSLPLLFWTTRGARLWDCHVFSAGKPRNASRRLLVVPSASAWATLDAAPRDPIACLAHELRTPLAAIQSYADLLLETHLLGGDDVGALNYAKNIRHAAKHGLDVVGSLLQRADVVEPDRLRQPLDLDSLIREAISTLRPLTAKAGARIDFVPAPKIPPVTSDAIAVAQILINLLANALRHAGGAPHVVVRQGRDPGRRVWVEIADDGCGFPEHVIQRFSRGGKKLGRAVPHDSKDGSETDSIGLALSHGLAIKAGARLTLGNRTAGGAVARLVFEAPEQRRKPAATPPATQRPRTSG